MPHLISFGSTEAGISPFLPFSELALLGSFARTVPNGPMLEVDGLSAVNTDMSERLEKVFLAAS